MIKSPRLTELGYSIFKKTVASKKLQILPTSVIYGSNASGKTNIVSAMEVLKKTILRDFISFAKFPIYMKKIKLFLLK